MEHVALISRLIEAHWCACARVRTCRLCGSCVVRAMARWLLNLVLLIRKRCARRVGQRRNASLRKVAMESPTSMVWSFVRRISIRPRSIPSSKTSTQVRTINMFRKDLSSGVARVITRNSAQSSCRSTAWARIGDRKRFTMCATKTSKTRGFPIESPGSKRLPQRILRSIFRA